MRYEPEPTLLIDGYKLDHRRQYPKGTTRIYSNLTARSSRIEEVDEVVFFGLQYFLKEYLEYAWAEFFNDSPEIGKKFFEETVNSYLPPGHGVGADHIYNLWELGYLPLEINAIPEGTRVPLRVPLLTVENTHPDFYWLTNYIETIMSCILWKPITSATKAHHLRRMLDVMAAGTGGDLGFVPWQAHDFSMRGMPGLEAALLSGAAHLTSFTGTDTLPALPFLKRYYGYGLDEKYLIGGSIPATEHSVMCAGGAATEEESFKRLITEVYPTGMVSIVSDTWDYWKVIRRTLPALKDIIMARDGKVVIRPDSSPTTPADILCGNPNAYDELEVKGTVEALWDIFGGTKTKTHYRLLDPHIGTIYGDSITYEMAKEICQRLAAKNFASTNFVMGVGSYHYTYDTRDTFGLAFKSTWAEIEGKGVDLFKTPKTDSGVKNSARGRLAVERDANTGRLALIEQAFPEDEARSLLTPVWRNGVLLREDNLNQIRIRLLTPQ